MVRNKKQPAAPSQRFSVEADSHAQTIAVEGAKRDQDNFGVYVYNDYSAYGCAECVENELLKIEGKIVAADLKGAFSLLEGFTAWASKEGDSFTTMDDGERANALIKLLSSAWVHVVAAGLAQLKEIVNFKFVLGKAAKLLELLMSGDLVAQGHVALKAVIEDKELRASDQVSSSDFQTQMKDYTKAFGKDNTIGGDAFDLSKQENIEKLGVEGSDSEDDEGEGGELQDEMLKTINETLAAQGRPLMTPEDIQGIIMRSLTEGGDDDDDEGEDEEEDEGESEEEEDEQDEGEEEAQAAAQPTKKARK